MILVSHPSEMQSISSGLHQIGFVPTLGGLHKGHTSLIERSLQENQNTIVSLFLNPTQFDHPEDLKNYPAVMEEDLEILEKIGVDYVFAPDKTELYPNDYRYKVIETEMSRQLCGSSRPGHFDGVLSVVLKLLLIVRANRAYFGEKDFQQLTLIKEMVESFFIPTEIVACPTVRDEFGLALSSRNERLSPQGLATAREFAKHLRETTSLDSLRDIFKRNEIKVDYLTEKQGRRFAAVFVENIRLIDNVEL